MNLQSVLTRWGHNSRGDLAPEVQFSEPVLAIVSLLPVDPLHYLHDLEMKCGFDHITLDF
jgi:hypothetical protein